RRPHGRSSARVSELVSPLRDSRALSFRAPNMYSRPCDTTSGDELAHLFPEAPEHPRLGLADGIGRDPQLRSDLHRQTVLDGHAPERRPGPVLELLLDLRQGTPVQPGDVVRVLRELERVIVLVVRRRGNLLEPLLEIGPAHGRLGSLTRMVPELVPR